MRHKNKIMSTVIAAILLSATPVWAQEGGIQIVQSETKQAPTQESVSVDKQVPAKVAASLAKIKKLIPSLADLTSMEKQLIPNKYGNGIKTWSIILSDRPEQADDEKEYTYAYLDFNAKTGQLVNMTYRNPEFASPDMPSDDLAKEKAEAFIQALLGDEMSDYKLSDRMGSGMTSYRDPAGKYKQSVYANVQFNRLVKNVPLSGFYAIVSVDEKGNILGYQNIPTTEIDESKFADPSKALSADEAKEAFSKQLEGQLAYNSKQPVVIYIGGSGNMETKPFLKYEFNAPIIDAITGEVSEELSHGRTGNTNIPVTLKPTGEGFSIRNQAEAEAFLKEELHLDLTDLEFEKVDLPEENEIYYVWSKGYGDKNDEPRRIRLHVNTTNNQIEYFATTDVTPSKNDDLISKDQAQEFVETFLSNYVTEEKQVVISHLELIDSPINIPDWVDQNKLDKDILDNSTPHYLIRVNGLHNGIQVEDESFSFTLDAHTGALKNLNARNVRANVELPASDKLVSKADAQQAFADATELQLEYIWPTFFGQVAPEPVLVYSPSSDWKFVDAVSGKVITVEHRSDKK
ncbi:YcdB/YcdC domain-containing protein [Brevibacillus dissolubilis]|uniref:YcdB/YcdC domain-containing protein n=1 Tax=Brevibacillus dissolubilis TaxID=1844116 RepID=UPI00111603C2|nr:YcdB/YcdC domain-containing protein [Brevibacillus dissolubilis]